MQFILPLLEQKWKSGLLRCQSERRERGTVTVLIAEDEQALRELWCADARGKVTKCWSREWRRKPWSYCGSLYGVHPIAAYRRDYAQAARAELASRLRCSIRGLKLSTVWLHGNSRCRTEFCTLTRCLLQKPFTVKRFWKYSTNECERTQLASPFFCLPNTPPAIPCAACSGKMIDRIENVQQWWIPKK